MKKTLMTAAILATTALTSSVVAASDGQINFTGEIITAACSVTNTPSAPLTVALGKVSKGAFTGAGTTASPTTFQLELTSCPDTASSASVRFDGTSVTGDTSILALNAATGVATGVGIQISDDAGAVVSLFQPSKTYTLAEAPAVNKLGFVARYIATATTITAGPANSTANFTINYN
ncbi:fimbrial protein [Dryocola clanedunensis]